jgi:hypothetical protein
MDTLEMHIQHMSELLSDGFAPTSNDPLALLARELMRPPPFRDAVIEHHPLLAIQRK